MVKSGNLKVYAAFAAVFVLGAITGGGAVHAFRERDVASFAADETGEVRERTKISALSRRLDLNDTQREKFRDITRRHRAERRELSRAMFERCGGPLREQKQKTDSEIRAMLDASQRQRFDEVEQKTRDRFPLGRRKE